MKRVINCSLFFFITVFFAACKKDPSFVTVKIGKEYFPFKIGAYVIYNVDSTFYDDFYIPTKAINTKYQLKEKIQSVYYDNEKRLTARLERYIRYYDSIVPYDSMQWKLKNVWAENITARTAEKVEENVRFVKLIFPIKENESWNVNAQNYLDSMFVSYKTVSASENIGGIAFDSIVQTEYDDGGEILTNRKYFTEKYAPNVGLIYKQDINVESQPDPNATSTELQLFYAKPILERITSGYQYTWTVVSYGVE